MGVPRSHIYLQLARQSTSSLPRRSWVIQLVLLMLSIYSYGSYGSYGSCLLLLLLPVTTSTVAPSTQPTRTADAHLTPCVNTKNEQGTIAISKFAFTSCEGCCSCSEVGLTARLKFSTNRSTQFSWASSCTESLQLKHLLNPPSSMSSASGLLSWHYSLSRYISLTRRMSSELALSLAQIADMKAKWRPGIGTQWSIQLNSTSRSLQRSIGPFPV